MGIESLNAQALHNISKNATGTGTPPKPVAFDIFHYFQGKLIIPMMYKTMIAAGTT